MFFKENPMSYFESILEIAQKSRKAANELATITTDDKNYALLAIADAFTVAHQEILEANLVDCMAAKGIEEALFNRLKLSSSKLNEAIAGIRDVAKLSDPIGKVLIHRQLDDNLVLKQVTCPLGVICVIFEARPEVLIQITALAIKSGNGVILKGGKEASQTCNTLIQVIYKALSRTKIPINAVQLLSNRLEVDALLQQYKYIDLIIPRGSQELVKYIKNNTKIPVVGHADGICHLYVDKYANLEMAISIAIDAKTQYPSACNSIETLLIHKDIAPHFVPLVISALQQHHVELRGDKQINAIFSLPLATDIDWCTEYSSLILAIKMVDSLEEAIDHINRYGSRHTEAIITEDLNNSQQFFSQVDAANVFHNCSTRFADGFRYGFGAEVGISTHKIPPRGPVGLEGLVTYKYQLVGHGDIASTYSGENSKSFNHLDFYE